MNPPSLSPRREHPRVRADFAVLLQLGTRSVEARARDLSMTGLFLERAPQVPDDLCLRIPLPGLDRQVRATCRVERRERRGVALSFANIDWDDLLLMARYLSPRL